MNTEPFEERAIFKVVTPTRIKRIGGATDFRMSSDADAGGRHQTQPDRFILRRPFARIDREYLFVPQPVAIPLTDPPDGFVGVSMLAPSHQTAPKHPFHTLERFRRHNVAMIGGPTPNDGVEPADQVGLADPPA